ncbi:MAG: hypothetical protein AAF726_21305 [Planctomycetota bacterium]
MNQTTHEALTAAAAALSTIPFVDEVKLVSKNQVPHVVARLVAPIFGRNLYFFVQYRSNVGLAIAVPDVIQAPLARAYQGIHMQALLANGAISGRTVIDEGGRLHYDLASLGHDLPDSASLEALLQTVFDDLETLLKGLIFIGISSLFQVSPELTAKMLDAAVEPDEEVELEPVGPNQRFVI